MKHVVQIQLSSQSAGSSAIKLHELFNTIPNLSCSIISLFPDDEKIEGVEILPIKDRYISRLNNFLEARLLKYDKSRFGLFSNPFLGSSIINHPSFKKASIVYIHWVQFGFLTLSQLTKIVATNKEIVFVFHDMWNITGGCHHASGCKGFLVDCQTCPIISGFSNLRWKQLVLKREIFNRTNVSIITPSFWLADLVSKSYVGRGKEVKTIPNYFNPKFFTKEFRSTLRPKKLENQMPKVITFAATHVKSAYKGFQFLLDALVFLPKIYSHTNILVQVIGADDLVDLGSIPYPCKALGFLNSEQAMAQALGFSDVFVIPSTSDNLPTIVMESLSCGVPVVGFPTGGIPEMIQHKINGYLAKSMDHASLAKGIKYCLENELEVELPDRFKESELKKEHVNFIQSLC